MTDAEKIQAAYDKLPFVGYFRVLAGSHTEGGRTYLSKRAQAAPGVVGCEGDIVHSKSHLLDLNPADRDQARKFEQIEPPKPKAAKAAATA